VALDAIPRNFVGIFEQSKLCGYCVTGGAIGARAISGKDLAVYAQKHGAQFVSRDARRIRCAWSADVASVLDSWSNTGIASS